MIRKLKKWFFEIMLNSIVHHLLFWALAYIILLNIFTNSSGIQKIDFIYTTIFMVSLFIPVAINLFVCIPKLLSKKKYLPFGFIFLGLLFFFSFLNQFIFDKLIDFLLPGYYFISYYTYGDVLIFFTVFLVLSTLLKLSKEWFELSETRRRLAQLEKEKAEAELKALSNQLNPHFLFNSLNVIYSLSLNNNKSTADAVIKLSDILRYVIYESSTELVSLGSEITLINNYLDLQRYRTDAGTRIEFHSDVSDDTLQIAPMLLLPLVENSFKHGIKGDVDDTFIVINLNSNRQTIKFNIENNKGSAIKINSKSKGGVGLQNIINRLDLIYQGKHSFTISETENIFRVELTISSIL